MQLHCRYCAAEIPAANINLDNLVAKCANCNAVYSIAGELGLASGEKDKTVAAPLRAEVPMPQGIEIKDEFDKLVIRRAWYSCMALPMLFFTVFWNGFMLMWFGISISMGAWQMALFGTLHGAIGVYLAYTTLASFLNATTITVTSDQLEIRHHPVPMPGSKTLFASEIVQLFCVQHVSRGSKGGTTISYQVNAIMQDQRRENLLKGLTNIEQALYIEQEIERYLRIENRQVQGEVEGY
jgi:hypothetical protein